MYMTYISYSTHDLLKVHVLNIHHQNISMSSYSSRGLIPKKWELFCYVPDNVSEVDIYGWNHSLPKIGFICFLYVHGNISSHTD